ncbi:hypothetical protein ACE1TI_07470 [Alteribacillus sp. JSM 102045]|uniref:hypothetical protein n=1 Tax=Alteribacillus sp. JSM 102045 TaxID=1562101 RepID=UPI0035C0941B
MSAIFAILERAKRHAAVIERSEREARQQTEAEKEKAQEAEPDKAVKITEFDLFKTADEKRNTAVKLLRDGLLGKGTRWKAMRNVLIPYLKTELGHDAEETKEILTEWTARLAWPQRWTYRDLLHRKINMGAKSFASEYMNESYADDEAIFRVDEYDYYRRAFNENSETLEYNGEYYKFRDLTIG